MAISSLVALLQSVPDGLVSLAVGLLGVALARWIFVNREVRRTSQPQAWTEQLPLTLMAMLVTGVLIWDRQLGLSSSAFLGLGVGWVAVLLLDIFGDRVLTVFRGSLQGGPANPNMPPQADHSGRDGLMDEEVTFLPPDMRDQLKRIDDAQKNGGKKDHF